MDAYTVFKTVLGNGLWKAVCYLIWTGLCRSFIYIVKTQLRNWNQRHCNSELASYIFFYNIYNLQFFCIILYSFVIIYFCTMFSFHLLLITFPKHSSALNSVTLDVWRMWPWTTDGRSTHIPRACRWMFVSQCYCCLPRFPFQGSAGS